MSRSIPALCGPEWLPTIKRPDGVETVGPFMVEVYDENTDPTVKNRTYIWTS